MPLLRKKNTAPILKVQHLKLHWDTEDPFTFASHHCDEYPAGNAQQAPPLAQISGRNLGRDYQKLFGFRMYHGKVVPGFPMHAHWGYETVTVPETGFIDHFDSLGNQGRFGFGDVQWVSAGSMYEHNEMYPLAFGDRPNPNDVTQIMIDLPMKMKGSPPQVKTVWSGDAHAVKSEGCSVKIIAGSFGGRYAAPPNSVSWASDPENNVRILRIEMRAGAKLTVPAAPPTVNRNLYFISGGGAEICGQTFESSTRLKIAADADLTMANGAEDSVFWLLEGSPINEKHVAFGPIILGGDKDVRDALNHIRENEFSQWPWDVVDKTQPKGTERFIRYSDGTEDRPAD
ncbi:MAG: pirin family protein [Candidatus Methanoplasma sp.]|jgi:redox-sensitive bicupin YhaK (pirin superfamily)|nr:pirin family protein [Candidatus Methanoplasma sp.]